MRFAFFAIIVASATSIMSVSAQCQNLGQVCQTTTDCCVDAHFGCTTISPGNKICKNYPPSS
ncbi:hypothetical protein BDR07DRAFT_1393041 [Suillus spraguei]|nr:hypothetical protein BDR07DRAFT_1393041 [Suillus spraguei]